MSRPPYPAQGNPGQASYPSSGQPQAPGRPPYPSASGQPGQGHAPYPTGGAPPYPAPGQPPYPAPGQQPYASGDRTKAPYPTGQPSYPAAGVQPPYPGGQQAPYPGGQQPGYPGGQQSPYPGGQQPPHSGGQQSGYPGGQQPPHSGGQQPGYPGGQQPPYPGGQQPPHSGGQQPGYPGGQQPPYPGGQQPPHSGGQQPGYPGGQQPGYPGGQQPPYPGGQQPPYPGGQQPPYPGGQQPTSQGGQQSPYPGGQAQYPGAQGQGYGQPQQHGANVPPGRPAPPAPGYPAAGAPTNLPPQGVPRYTPSNKQCLSKVDIRIECRNLLDLDILSKSDPCAALYMNVAGRWMEVGRTENIKNSLNPKFTKCFEVDYFFEEVQKIMVRVYDLDNVTVTLDDDDFLGQVECTLGQVVAGQPLVKPMLLKNGKKLGNAMMTIRAEEKQESKEHLLLTFRAKGLEKKDFLGKSDPYLEFLRSSSDGTWQVVHRTEVIKNNLNPSWRPFQISLPALCNNDKTKVLRIDCYDWDSDGSHDLIGSFTTTVDEMMKAVTNEVTWPCVNPKKKAKKKGYQNSGLVILASVKKILEHSFLDFIMSGTQINFTVGVDFTASNGHPSQSTSLHYINPHQPNEYAQAIRAVGDVCQDYDTDKMFPALGFGARLPPSGQVSHEFAINFNPQNPYCAEEEISDPKSTSDIHSLDINCIEGVLSAYQNCIRSVELYGPTNVAPIIYHVAKFASQAQSEEATKGANAYYILLLLSDGVLSDMSETIKAIVYASGLPFSLIIVGVGGADFTDMNVLDGDNGVLKAPNGQPVKRDIVQFVPFRQFQRASGAELARHVLAEVPKQVTDYFKMRGLHPTTAPH